MVTPYEYALLSIQAYNNPGDGYQLPPGWHLLDVSQPSSLGSGYFGVAFIKGNDVVIAHRGTEFPTDIGDAISDLQLALDFIPNQFTDAIVFINHIETLSNQTNISFTGHSLGGLLAQLSAAKFNLAGTIFDSPGAKELLNEIGLVQNPNVTLYAAAPDLINATNTQIADIHRLYIDSKIDGSVEDITGHIPDVANYLNYSVNYQHSKSAIAASFNPSTGLPYIESVTSKENWPTSGFNHYASYAENTFFWDRYFAFRNISSVNKLAQIKQDLHGLGDTSRDGVHIEGDETNNHIWGATTGRDVIIAHGGDDTIHGFAGSDTLDGGAGDDTLSYEFSVVGSDAKYHADVMGSAAHA